LDAGQAMAFGDNHNDLEMISAVGCGVAMGNATQALKDIAADVCKPVSEDGIYHYCRARGLI
jgi:hydroxymethylpyrimidine pyrophosphatase-like HAD family hydrolase